MQSIRRAKRKFQRNRSLWRHSFEHLEDRAMLAGISLSDSTFSISQFEANLFEQAGDPAEPDDLNVVGYSYSLSQREDGFPFEGITAQGGVGLARVADDAEPDLERNLFTSQALASVSKPITATAILQILADQTDSMQELQDALDQSIDQYLPDSWTLASWVSSISLRDLLAHESGFGQYDDQDPDDDDDNLGASRTDAQLMTLLSTPCLNADITDATTPCVITSTSSGFGFNYTSTNYSLFRVILPYLWNPSNDNGDLVGLVLDPIDNGDPSAVENLASSVQDAIAEDFDLDSITQTEVTAALYKYYVVTNVLEPAGIIAPNTINLGADGELNTGDETLAYDFPGVNPEDTGDRTLRAGALSWNLSTFDLDSFLSVLRYTETILDEETRDLMLTENLGWRDADVVNGDFGTYFGHNGVNTGSRINTQVMNYPGNVQASLTINSTLDTDFGSAFNPQGNNRGLRDTLNEAYDNAWTDIVYDGFTDGDIVANDTFTLQWNEDNPDWIDFLHGTTNVFTRRADTLHSLTINGLGGVNTYNIDALPSTLQLNINGGNLVDIVNLGDEFTDLDQDMPGGLDNNPGGFMFDGAGNFDQLFVDDGGEDNHDQLYTVSNTSVTRTFDDEAQLEFDFTNVESVFLNTSDLDDTVNVVTTAGVSTVNVNARFGDDTITGGDLNDVLRGGDGDDVISGGGGDDEIIGSSGFDTLSGNDGNDTINGNSDDDTIYGGAGNDDIYGESGQDELHGGDGNDTITGSLGDDVIYGDGENDHLSGNDGNDTIFGGKGADTLYGHDGDDNLSGEDGQDTILGSIGNDTISGGAGADDINGGNDNDTIEGGDGADTINGGNHDDTIDGDGGDDFIEGWPGHDLIDGGTGDDEILGGAGDDLLIGGVNDDKLIGGHGSDTLFGDDGEDQLIGGHQGLSFGQIADMSNDFLDGGAGDDALAGDNAVLTFGNLDVDIPGGGNDIILGGGDDDLIFGQDGDDQIQGNAGNDSIFAMAGFDLVIGGSIICRDKDPNPDPPNGPPRDGPSPNRPRRDGPTNDPIKPTRKERREFVHCFDEFRPPEKLTDEDPNVPPPFPAVLAAADGTDIIEGGSETDILVGDNWSQLFEEHTGGGAGDRIEGNEDSDTIFGQVGDDDIQGDDGNDVVLGGIGEDMIEGGQDNDWLSGQQGADVMNGGDEEDHLDGGAGADTLSGGDDADSLLGGDGNDVLLGGDGLDLLQGNAGNDTMRGNADDDQMFGGDGNDALFGGGGGDFMEGQAGDDLMRGETGDDQMFGNDGNDNMVGDDGDDQMVGGQGIDRIRGADGDDRMVGGDLTIPDPSRDLMAGGDGSDIIRGDSGPLDASPIISLIGGNDLIFGGDDSDTILAMTGNDIVVGDDGNDVIDGGPNRDFLRGGDGRDLIRGGDHDDALFGNDGPDILLGEGGNDILRGGTERDLLIGGRNSDLVVGQGGQDIVLGDVTNHDANDAALRAILAEWNSANSYAERIQNIMAMNNPTFATRLNGNFFLIPSGAGVTIQNDFAVDTLFGLGDRDWFLADPLDTAFDAAANELVSAIV